MLEHCFRAPANDRPNQPTRSLVLAPRPGNGFEARAFTALWNNRQLLGIAQLWKCHSARVDGCLETVDGEIILLEMKTTLGWGQTQAAAFQFLAGRDLLNLPATRGIIVFGRESPEWATTQPYGASGQLALEASSVAAHIQIGALRVDENGGLQTYGAARMP